MKVYSRSMTPAPKQSPGEGVAGTRGAWQGQVGHGRGKWGVAGTRGAWQGQVGHGRGKWDMAGARGVTPHQAIVCVPAPRYVYLWASCCHGNEHTTKHVRAALASVSGVWGVWGGCGGC